MIRISITAAAFASTLPFAQAAAAEKAKLAAQKAWQTRRASPNYVALDRLRYLRGPELCNVVAAPPPAGLAFDREGRDEEVREGVGVLSHRR